MSEDPARACGCGCRRHALTCATLTRCWRGSSMTLGWTSTPGVDGPAAADGPVRARPFQVTGQQLSVPATRRTLARIQALFGGDSPLRLNRWQ